MVPVTARRGGALLEIVVALPLIALVLAVATALLLTQSRVTLTTSARTEASATLAQAAHVLAHDVRPLDGRDLIAWTDSSLYADVPVLVAVSCGAPAPHVIDVVMSPGAAEPLWHSHPLAGDAVRWAMPDTSLVGDRGADTTRVAVTLRDVATTASACSGAPLRGAQSPTRLILDAPPPDGAPVPPGVVIVVQRRVEWRAYRAADGATWLGRRERQGGVWTVLQPAVGPFEHVTAGGVRVRVRRRDGSEASSGASDAAVVDISLRALRRDRASDAIARAESLRVSVALRGGH